MTNMSSHIEEIDEATHAAAMDNYIKWRQKLDSNPELSKEQVAKMKHTVEYELMQNRPRLFALAFSSRENLRKAMEEIKAESAGLDEQLAA